MNKNDIYKSTKFITYVNKFKNETNNILIESIIKGFSVILEYPHAITKSDNFIDFHVEDVVNQKGNAYAVKYINNLINSLKNDQPLEIEYNRTGELNRVIHPSSEIVKSDLNSLVEKLEQLNTFYHDDTSI